MNEQNVIFISLDEVPAHNLSCYGYKRIETSNIDRVAEKGVLFEECIAPGCLTPVCMSSVMCGQYPNKHGFRVPLCRIQSKTIAEVLKEYGYNTAGFVGNGLLCSMHRFNAGFDSFDESTEDNCFDKWYPGTDSGEPGHEEELVFYEGNFWLDKMFGWLKANYRSPFFIWGHVQETHEGAEGYLLQNGLIKEGVLPEFSYKDARLKYVDDALIGRLLQIFDELKLWENTVLVIMADHGHNVGEHPVKTIPLRPGGLRYPQHRSLYDHDLTVPVIMMGKDLPKNKRIKGMVRSIDIIPTLLCYLGISVKDFDFDGINLLPVIEKERAEGLIAYAEDLYEYRTNKFVNFDTGSLQAIRTEKVKLIRNLTKGTEEFYDLQNDPGERQNLIEEVKTSEEVVSLRRRLNTFLVQSKDMKEPFSLEQEKIVENRLRALGYQV